MAIWYPRAVQSFVSLKDHTYLSNNVIASLIMKSNYFYHESYYYYNYLLSGISALVYLDLFSLLLLV